MKVLKAALVPSILATALHAGVPVTVSPGEAHRLSFVEVRCPTFSWGLLSGAESYSVSVFALDATGAPETVPVLQKNVPVGVTSWTPSLGSCLEPGSRYAWVVTAERESGGAQVPASDPRFFAIADRQAPAERGAAGALPAAPGCFRRSPTSVTDALAAQPTGSRLSVSPTGKPPTALSLLSLEAAIQGEVVDTNTGTGVVGVAGIADSTLGAGLYAANLSTTGADLVLDGSAQGVSDTVVTESGVIAGDGVFEFTNAGNDLVLRLNGTSVTTEATDDDTLASLTCSGPDEVAKWDGTQWLCLPEMADQDSLGALSCAEPDRVPKWDGSQWSCLREESAFAVIAPGTGLSATADTPGDTLSITGAGNIAVNGPGGDAIEVSVVQGPGSGLDADTLDGLQGSGYAPSDHDHMNDTWNTAASTISFDFVTPGPVWAAAIWGEVGLVTNTSSTGVWATSSSGDGVSGETSGVDSYGGSFSNTAPDNGGVDLGAGLAARGNHDSAPDIVLRGSSVSADAGRIWSDPDFPSSDIYLVSNDNVIIQLEVDGSPGDEDADFEVRRNGGVTIFRVDDTAGVTISDGLIVNNDATINGDLTVNGTLNNPSDRARKENVLPAKVDEVLEQVVALPIRLWNFVDDPDDTPHLGPMAQDFRAAFGLGADERYIASVDADGVALAAIQGLYRLLMEQRDQLGRLEDELERLRSSGR